MKMDSNQENMLLTFLIHERLCIFGRAVDSKNFSQLSEVFSPSAEGDYGVGRGHTGLDQLINAMEHNLGIGSNCGPSQHNILNLQVAKNAEGGVDSRANFYAVHEGVGRLKGEIWSTWGEYNDSWILTSEGWRIQHRRYVTFFSQGPEEIVSRD